MYYNVNDTTEKWVKTMCKIFEEYGDERAAEAVANRNIELVEKLLKDGSLSVEKITEITTIPLEQVQKIAEKLKMPELA